MIIEHLFIQLFGVEYSYENIADIIAGGIFVLTGFTVRYISRVKSVLNKENRFSVGYFVKNNWDKIIKNILIMFLLMRFTQEIIGVEYTVFVSVIIGYNCDSLRKLFDNAMNKYKG